MNKRRVSIIVLAAFITEALFWIIVGLFGKVGADGFNDVVDIFLLLHRVAVLVDPDPAGVSSCLIYSFSGFCQWLIVGVVILGVFLNLKKRRKD